MRERADYIEKWNRRQRGVKEPASHLGVVICLPWSPFIASLAVRNRRQSIRAECVMNAARKLRKRVSFDEIFQPGVAANSPENNLEIRIDVDSGAGSTLRMDCRSEKGFSPVCRPLRWKRQKQELLKPGIAAVFSQACLLIRSTGSKEHVLEKFGFKTRRRGLAAVE